MSHVPSASWLTERRGCGSPRTGLRGLPSRLEGNLPSSLVTEVELGEVEDDMCPSPHRKGQPASAWVKSYRGSCQKSKIDFKRKVFKRDNAFHLHSRFASSDYKPGGRVTTVSWGLPPLNSN